MPNNPGKFEGEPRYVPTFWDHVLNGDIWETYCDGWVRVEIQPEDVAEFPELEGFTFVDLRECNAGFVQSFLIFL